MRDQTEAVTIPSGWVTREEAEKLTGKSIKTLQRLMREGAMDVQRRELDVPGRSKPVTIYREADLRPESRAVIPAPPAQVPARSNLQGLDLLGRKLEELSRIYAQRPVPIEAKTLLTLDEAHAFSGVPKRYLREMRRETPECGKKYGTRFFYRRSVLAGL